jgi:hypothetical protein
VRYLPADPSLSNLWQQSASFPILTVLMAFVAVLALGFTLRTAKVSRRYANEGRVIRGYINALEVSKPTKDEDGSETFKVKVSYTFMTPNNRSITGNRQESFPVSDPPAFIPPPLPALIPVAIHYVDKSLHKLL